MQRSLVNRRAAALALLIAAVLLSGCGTLLQKHLVGNSNLTALVAFNRFPIYWVGGSFEGRELTEVTHEWGGAYSLQYGDCSLGGQAMCVAPLVIVTSPEDTLKTGISSSSDTFQERGVTGLVRQQGRTLELATGKVLVEIEAENPALARAAAASMAPINRLGTPSSTLPAPAPPSAGPAEPLPGQLPKSLSVVHGKLHSSGAHLSGPSGPTGPSAP